MDPIEKGDKSGSGSVVSPERMTIRLKDFTGPVVTDGLDETSGMVNSTDPHFRGAPITQWVEHWPTDLAVPNLSPSCSAKSSQL